MLSHPARDAWIEIPLLVLLTYHSLVSHPARDAWIEIMLSIACKWYLRLSHPARDAWIEIYVLGKGVTEDIVASREGCVD